MRQTLRPYQSAALAKVLDAFKRGQRSVLLVLPTGGGKTTIFSDFVASIPGRALVLVHRRELATQAAARLREFGVDFGFEMAGEPRKPYARVQIASVQTLVRRTAPKARLVVVDEAHLSTAESYQKILDCYPHAWILGVTATPWRLSGKPLAGLYKEIVVASTPAQLCTDGFLAPFTGFSYKAPDLSQVERVGDDYNQGQSAKVMSAIVPNVVEQWKATASHLSTVVFACTVEHSQALTAEFRNAGVSAEHLDGGTPIEQRRAVLERVASGKTQVLCNVGIAVEGLDIPRLKCCVLARPTMSLTRAIQMMGRVRRPWNGVTARIHDHAFVIGRHGLPDADRDYSLDPDAAPPLPSLRTCKACFALYVGDACPSCAHVNEPEIRGERKGPEIVEDAEQFGFSSGEAPPPEALPPVRVTWQKPRTIEGVFESKSEERTQYGMRPIYRVRGRRIYECPGTSELNKLLAKVPQGAKVRIGYLGEKLLGRITEKKFAVQVATDA